MRIAAGIAVSVPVDVLVGDEQAPREQPRLAQHALDALGAVQLLGGLAPARPDVARRGAPTPASAPAARRRVWIHFGSSGASTCVSIPGPGRCVANLSGRWTPPPPAGGKYSETSRTFTAQ